MAGVANEERIVWTSLIVFLIMKRVLICLVIMLCISNIACVWFFMAREERRNGLLQDSINRQLFYIHKLEHDLMTKTDYEEVLKLQLKGLRNDNRSGDVCPACGNDSSIAALNNWGCFPPENPYLEYCIEKLRKNHIRVYRLPDEVLPVNNPGENAKRYLCSECGYKWGHID